MTYTPPPPQLTLAQTDTHPLAWRQLVNLLHFLSAGSTDGMERASQSEENYRTYIKLYII